MSRPDETLSVGDLFVGSARHFHRHFVTVVSYGVLFAALNSLVLGPAFSLLFAFIVNASGDPVVNNEEILEFLLSPIGIGAAVILLAATMTTTMTLQAGLMIIFANERGGRSTTSLQALVAMLWRLPGILAINLARAVLLLLVGLPFAGIASWYYASYLSSYDLNYLVEVRPLAFWWGVAAAILIVVAAAVVLLFAHIRVAFVFPAYFFDHSKLTTAVRQSAQLARGHMLPLVGFFAAWISFGLVVSFAIRVLFEQLGPRVLSLAGQRLEVVVAVIGLLLAAQALALAAVNLWSLGVGAIGVGRAYVLLTTGDRLEVPVERALAPHRRRTLWTIGGIVAVFLVSAGFTTVAAFDAGELDTTVVITAHRGSSGVAPENTLAAIRRAIDDGADYAEIDVQETADGEVVLLHDTDLRRVAGLGANIWEMTYDDLRGLDAGSWFSPEFVGEHIPTLAEAIEVADQRIKLNIEIKLNGHERNLVENVVRIIEEAGFESQSIVTSLSRRTLDRVAELNPGLRRGYIVFQTLGRIDRINADAIMIDQRLATPLTVKAAHDAGLEIHVWTVNNASRMSLMIDRGVDGILTDYPDRLVDLLEQRAELNDIQRLVLRFGELVSR